MYCYQPHTPMHFLCFTGYAKRLQRPGQCRNSILSIKTWKQQEQEQYHCYTGQTRKSVIPPHKLSVFHIALLPYINVSNKIPAKCLPPLKLIWYNQDSPFFARSYRQCFLDLPLPHTYSKKRYGYQPQWTVDNG